MPCSTIKTSALIRKHSSMSRVVFAALIVIIPAPVRESDFDEAHE
jgi:hypothetical protein